MNYQWLKISDPVEDLNFFVPKNQVKTIRVNGKEFCVGHLEGGFCAIQNTCPHAGASLGEGWLDGKGNVICPHHRYKFSMKNGSNTSGEGYYVHTYPVEVREDGIYLGIPERRWLSFW